MRIEKVAPPAKKKETQAGDGVEQEKVEEKTVLTLAEIVAKKDGEKISGYRRIAYRFLEIKTPRAESYLFASLGLVTDRAFRPLSFCRRRCVPPHPFGEARAAEHLVELIAQGPPPGWEQVS